MAHGPGCRWPSRGKEGIDQGTQGANRVPAGLPCVAQNKYLDRTKLPHGNIQFKIFEKSADGRMQIPSGLFIAQTCYGQAPYFWQIYLPVSVHRYAGIKIYLPPGPN